MSYKIVAIGAIAASLLSGYVSAAVNTSTLTPASGTARFTTPSITSHTINGVPALSAGYQQANLYRSVGVGQVVTSSGSLVAVKPGASYALSGGSGGYQPSRDLAAVGRNNPSQKVILSISRTDAPTNTVPFSIASNPEWVLIDNVNLNTITTYYIVMPGDQNIPADTYEYSIDAATYSS